MSQVFSSINSTLTEEYTKLLDLRSSSDAAYEKLKADVNFLVMKEIELKAKEEILEAVMKLQALVKSKREGGSGGVISGSASSLRTTFKFLTSSPRSGTPSIAPSPVISPTPVAEGGREKSSEGPTQEEEEEEEEVVERPVSLIVTEEPVLEKLPLVRSATETEQETEDGKEEDEKAGEVEKEKVEEKQKHQDAEKEEENDGEKQEDEEKEKEKGEEKEKEKEKDLMTTTPKVARLSLSQRLAALAANRRSCLPSPTLRTGSLPEQQQEHDHSTQPETVGGGTEEVMKNVELKVEEEVPMTPDQEKRRLSMNSTGVDDQKLSRSPESPIVVTSTPRMSLRERLAAAAGRIKTTTTASSGSSGHGGGNTIVPTSPIAMFLRSLPPLPDSPASGGSYGMEEDEDEEDQFL